MMRLLGPPAVALALAVCLLALSACSGAGTYVHAVGTCSARADGYKISVKVWRDVGRSDAVGKSVLLRACGEVARRP